jgi:Membrane-bound serine protease (ClpP class)
MLALTIALIIIGLILLSIELLIIPGFGIAGILGITSLIGACYFAFAGFGTIVGMIVMLGIIALVIIGVLFIMRTDTWKKISLKTNIDSKVDDSPDVKGLTVGLHGKTITRLAPGGQVIFDNKIVEVYTRDGLIEPGKEVEISSIEDNRIFVSLIK